MNPGGKKSLLCTAFESFKFLEQEGAAKPRGFGCQSLHFMISLSAFFSSCGHSLFNTLPPSVVAI